MRKPFVLFLILTAWAWATVSVSFLEGKVNLKLPDGFAPLATQPGRLAYENKSHVQVVVSEAKAKSAQSEEEFIKSSAGLTERLLKIHPGAELKYSGGEAIGKHHWFRVSYTYSDKSGPGRSEFFSHQHSGGPGIVLLVLEGHDGPAYEEALKSIKGSLTVH